MEKLPFWRPTKGMPASYDSETATVIEMVAKLYGSMSEMIDEYNKYVTEINLALEKYYSDVDKDIEALKNQILTCQRKYHEYLDMRVDKQDKVLQEAVNEMKAGLSQTITDLIQAMVDNGEMEAIILDSLSGYDEKLSDFETRLDGSDKSFELYKDETNQKIYAINENISKSNQVMEEFNDELSSTNDDVNDSKLSIKGLARKLMGVMESLREAFNMSKESYDALYCEVTNDSGSNIAITIHNPFDRVINIVYDESNVSLYELRYISSYGLTRSSVYSGTGNNKTLNFVYVDGVKVDSFDYLKNVGLTFKTLMINYTMAESDTVTFDVTLIVTPKGVKIIETVNEGNEAQLNTSFAKGSYFLQLFSQGTKMQCLQDKNSKTKAFFQYLDLDGNTIVKTFTNGGEI